MKLVSMRGRPQLSTRPIRWCRSASAVRSMVSTVEARKSVNGGHQRRLGGASEVTNRSPRLRRSSCWERS